MDEALSDNMNTTVRASVYPIHPTEKQLVAACLAQDRRAQKQLYDKYKDAMYTLAYRVTNDFELAQMYFRKPF